MKIRTRLLLNVSIFGLILLIIAVLLVITFREIDYLNRQEEIARSIEEISRELSYLSNDYLLHRESQQLARWHERFQELLADIQQLQLADPRQKLLASQLDSNALRMESVFIDITNTIEAEQTDGAGQGGSGVSLRFVQVSWSRLEVQNQNIIFTASQLVQELLYQKDQTRQRSVILIYVLSGVFAAFLLSSYLFIYRRVLLGLEKLQAGTRMVASGNLNHRIEDQQPDEFGELSRAFNRMTARLHETMASKVDLEREIAERQLAEEALQASQASMRRLVEADIIGVFTRDHHGQVIEANAVFLNLVGAEPGDLARGKLNTLDLIPEEKRELERRRLEAGGWDEDAPREKTYRRKDGHLVPVLEGETQVSDGLYPRWIGFVLDLTELKRAQANLADYAEKLKASNQELENFAFIASHDLKEPLRKIRSFADLLVRSRTDQMDEEMRDMIQRMKNAAARMQAMIDDLLELSRTGRRNEPFVSVSLSELAAEVVSDLEVRLYAEGGSVEVEPLPVIEADPVQMRQLLQNLIANGIKYHRLDEKPHVRVWSRPDDVSLPGGPPSLRDLAAASAWQDEPSGTASGTPAASVTLCVEDNGIGFELEYLEKIFQPFTRLHGRDAYEGTGMGLAICKKIVERHHGRITACSAPGEGSTFLVTLPVRQGK